MSTDLDARIEALEVRPGDVVVVSCANLIAPHVQEAIRTMVEGAVADLGVKVLVLDDGMTLSVVRAPPGA